MGDSVISVVDHHTVKGKWHHEAEFFAEVQEYVRNGWRVTGPYITTHTGPGLTAVYLQTMTKTTEMLASEYRRRYGREPYRGWRSPTSLRRSGGRRKRKTLSARRN